MNHLDTLLWRFDRLNWRGFAASALVLLAGLSTACGSGDSSGDSAKTDERSGDAGKGDGDSDERRADADNSDDGDPDSSEDEDSSGDAGASAEGDDADDETNDSDSSNDDADSDASDSSAASTDDEEPDSMEDGTDAAQDAGQSTSSDSDTSSSDEASPSGESSGAATSSRDRLPESLRETCMDWCDAQFETECAPLGFTSIEICDLQCVAAVSTQRDFCIEEYTERTRCLADGGYECINDNPVARATCASETLAYSECVQELPCKMYCAALVESGCADDESACREECIADSTDDDLSCEIRQDSYVLCMGQLGFTCDEGQVIPHQSCLPSLFDAADCRNDRDVCATWCEGADALGCGGTDCVAECQAAAEEPTCGSDYTRMLECGIRYGYVGCTSDGLETDPDSIICDSEIERYDECLTSQEQQ
jgi:hypothetical protein